MSNRLYIFGPSGSGTTTLARALAEELGICHIDTDDYYWKQTKIPYTETQSIADRISAIKADLDAHEGWIISGCMCSWGEPILKDVSHVIYLWLPWEIRKQRIIAREEIRYGVESIREGGDRYDLFQKFIEWAELYDSADASMRSRARHEEWIDSLGEKVKLLRLEEDITVAKRVELAQEWLSR